MSLVNEESLKEQVEMLKDSLRKKTAELEELKKEKSDFCAYAAGLLLGMTVGEAKSDKDVWGRVKRALADLCKSVDFATDMVREAISAYAKDSNSACAAKIKSELDNPMEDCTRQLRLLKGAELVGIVMNDFSENGASASSESEGEMAKDLGNQIQQLISDTHFEKELNDELTLIRYKLLAGAGFAELPLIAVKVLKLMVHGYKIERNSAQAFLQTLNTNLSDFSSKVETSAKTVKEGLASDNASSDRIDLAINSISKSIESEGSMEELRTKIMEQVSSIKKSMAEHRESIGKQAKFIATISRIQDHLKKMVDETDEFRQKLDSAEGMYLRDSLTTLDNRHAFDAKLDSEYIRWKRYRTDLTVAVIDVDNFKMINEKYGHPAGDRALQVIARALRSKIRASDFIARYSGEKFAAIFISTPKSAVAAALQKLNEAVRDIPFHFKDSKVEITVSIGAATFEGESEPAAIFGNAEKALTEAKTSGKDCFKLYSEQD